ncbi:transcription antitermination factor NusB [Brochothrix campestris]|uniref:Transcription antitermination protein NusB n=1 Tax=Brochothrix campestris FSL F6-1037 TaxID=1265861 RepID=W7CVC0_9LIST|nr:transcription antitermination factor NusB [Brochothrix campestris]EUJ40645.1 transcription antitermination protein NusB [Brochothrix campestris FSL F6-1037]
MKRREAREKAVQILFQFNFDKELTVELAINNVTSEPDEYLVSLVKGTLAKEAELDEIIKAHLVKWRIERINKVDLAILRIATYELLFDKETPTNVVINEAIDLSRLFGDDQSRKFVNGMMSNIAAAIDEQ